MRVKIAPSLLAADFSRLGEEIGRAEAAGADMLHLDVMDGHFVPNLTLGPPVVKALRPHSRLPFDVHLMVDNADRFLDPFAEAGADALTVHIEVFPDPTEVLDRIGALGKERGLSLNPDTPVARVAPFLDKVDRLLVMSVFPGFGGQSFIEETYDRLREATAAIGDRPVDLQIDGGIYADNAPAVIAAGVTNIVAGTATFRADDMAAVIRRLRGEDAATAAGSGRDP